MTATAQSPPREGLPDELVVGRGDPVYMAHAYLTKVPVPAIIPFIEAFTRPGDVVVDPFAGSGMTGVAAVAAGRRSRMSDVSVLGRHLGTNYLNLVDRDVLAKLAAECVEAARRTLGPLYRVACTKCGRDGDLVKEVWSVVIECRGCRQPVNYYDALEAADWSKPDMECPHCPAPVDARCARVGEAPVLDYVDCSCAKTQVLQAPGRAPSVDLDAVRLSESRDRVRPPDVPVVRPRQARADLGRVVLFSPQSGDAGRSAHRDRGHHERRPCSSPPTPVASR